MNRAARRAASRKEGRHRFYEVGEPLPRLKKNEVPLRLLSLEEVTTIEQRQRKSRKVGYIPVPEETAFYVLPSSVPPELWAQHPDVEIALCIPKAIYDLPTTSFTSAVSQEVGMVFLTTDDGKEVDVPLDPRQWMTEQDWLDLRAQCKAAIEAKGYEYLGPANGEGPYPEGDYGLLLMGATLRNGQQVVGMYRARGAGKGLELEHPLQES